MTLLSGFIFGFLFIRLIISLINLLSSTRLPVSKTPGQQIHISVLIPARNEDTTIGNLLDDLIQSNYARMEILIYDDHSEDYTKEVVNEKSKIDSRIQSISTKELPSGWSGKNYACHQLAMQASGKYLLFLDADVRIKPGLIRDSLAYIEKHNLRLLSIFLQQTMKTIGERITVPLMNWILTSLLPLPLIKDSPYKSLAAANGQFMLFETKHYRQNQWHKLMKTEAVEDIRIMRAIKEKGLKAHTLLSNGQITCRMYRNFRETVNDFSKNTHAFFGNKRILMSLFTLVTGFGFLPFVLFAGWRIIVLYFLSAILLRIFTSAASLQNPLKTVLQPHCNKQLSLQ